MWTAVTWNVNSVKTRSERLVAFLKKNSPDVVCLQEIKCVDELFPTKLFEDAGYHSTVYGQKTYNGVALLTKKPIKNVFRGFDDGLEEEARFIGGELGKTVICCGYFPNGRSVGVERYFYKLHWYQRLCHFIRSRELHKKKLIVAGDFNVAPEDADVHNPNNWRGKILCSGPEREALKEVIDLGMVDTFRLHNKKDGQFSWWDYRGMSYPKNYGLRIDFVLASKSLAKQCEKAEIIRKEREGDKPSDHAPVMAAFEGSP